MWYNSRFIKYAARILLSLLILYLTILVLPFFYPLLNFIEFFFSPLVIGIVLYYMFRPMARWLMDHRVPFSATVLIIFLLLGGVIATIVTTLAPLVIAPIQEVAVAPSQKFQEVKEATLGFLNIFNFNLYSYEEIRSLVGNYVIKIQQYVLQNTFSIISTITHVAFIFVITPFCLFYFLRDGAKFHEWLMDAVPDNYRSQVSHILEHLDQTLVTFFNGQITIALGVTTLAGIGLALVGIDNLAFLIFFTFLLTLIPYLGTFVAIIPPVLVGLTMSYFMALGAAAVMIAVHLTEANFITPQVMMRRFDIHPLTVILLVVASFSIFGITGPLWITPAYVFIRELVVQAYAFWLPRQRKIET